MIRPGALLSTRPRRPYPAGGNMRAGVVICLGLVAAGPPGSVTGVGLEAEPLVAEAVGLRMRPPAGAVTTVQADPGGASYVLGDSNETWSMRIAPLHPAAADPSPEDLIEEHLRAVAATGRAHRILANEPRQYGGINGHLLYLQQTLDDRRSVVNGWLVLPTSEQTFLVFSLMTRAEDFARLRPVFDGSFATIELRGREALAEQRKQELERGRTLVRSFTPEALKGLAGFQRWYRIFRPAVSGRQADDTEVGFLNLRAVEGLRGELTPERSPESYSAMEAEQGLMVLLKARAVVDAKTGHYLDVDGRYWMAWDRSKEAWSVRQTSRKGDASQSTADTGVRNGMTLDIIHSVRERLTREPTQWTIPDPAYLCQPEAYMLGRLLPRDGTLDGDVTWYHFDPRTRRLAQRVDHWQAEGDLWVLTTQPLLEVAHVTQVYDADGRRLKRIDGDGTLTEPIDPRDLQRLWRSKGLLER